MSRSAGRNGCDRAERLVEYALEVLPPADAADMQTHVAGCPECRQQLASLRPVVDSFVAWPADVLRPPVSLWDRLAERIAAETGGPVLPPAAERWVEPEWEEAAPGISVKLLATDRENHRVSMLVRFAPGAAYPAHVHAGVEELHLLDGELVNDEKKLSPGDYNRGEPGDGDTLVWSETGCTCVLITSTRDQLL